jgi:subtilisin family serine protease
MRRYTILRDLTGLSTAEPIGPGPRGGALESRTLAPPEPKVEVESLTPKEVRSLARDPQVMGIAPIMPTRLIRPFEVQVGAEAAAAWGIEAVRADRSDFTGAGAVVAVLDTGIDAGHPAFAGVELVQQDFSGSGNGDRQGHGTHCAGTIFGRDVDGTRICIARGVGKALIGKVLGDQGSGDSDMIFRGIEWALQEGADVISMSLGFDFPGLVNDLVTRQRWPVDLATSLGLEAYRGNLRMFDALMGMVRARLAFDEGTILCAAAGNESRRDENKDFEIAASLPAAAEGVVSVGALQRSEQGFRVAAFSNTFPQVSAPGVDVLSAKVGGGLRSLSGTSMATPHVAGVTALWWEAVRATAGRPNSTAVLAKLLAASRAEGLAPGVDEADRGLGIVTAP